MSSKSRGRQREKSQTPWAVEGISWSKWIKREHEALQMAHKRTAVDFAAFKETAEEQYDAAHENYMELIEARATITALREAQQELEGEKDVALEDARKLREQLKTTLLDVAEKSRKVTQIQELLKEVKASLAEAKEKLRNSIPWYKRVFQK